MLVVVLGLASSVSWGLADFLGGISSRRAPAVLVVALSQAVGLALALALLAAVRPDVPTTSDLALGVAAGLTGVLGLVAFYRGMAIGSISIVAPVGALGALVPLAADLARGRQPGTVALVGMIVALGGAALAARAPGPASRRGIGLALVAALAFGSFFLLLSEAADGAGALWALAAARAGSAPIAAVASLVLLAGGRPRALRGRVVTWVVLAGLLDAGANLLFALGTGHGLVSVVAVLGSLYPVVTVALAGAVLGERLSSLQATGAALALGGVVLIAAG